RMKELRGVQAEIVSVRAEMVENDVQQDHEPALMRGIYQSLEHLGPAISHMRCIKEHTVIPPAPIAGELRHRHQLERRNPEVHKINKLLSNTIKGAFLRKCPGMDLVNNSLVPGPSRPFRSPPFIGMRVD